MNKSELLKKKREYIDGLYRTGETLDAGRWEFWIASDCKERNTVFTGTEIWWIIGELDRLGAVA